MNPYTQPGSVKVADLFAVRRTVCPFLPGGAFSSVEKMLESFDYPDQLAIIDGVNGRKEICLKVDAEYLVERLRVTNELLLAKICKFSLLEILEMRKRIDKIMGD